MKALVIGATGFIGVNLVDALIAEGIDVRAARRKRSPTILLARRTVEFVPASIEEPRAMREAMDGCDAVFYAAGYYPRYSLDRESAIEQGVSQVRAVCEAAMDVGVKKLVYTSSVGSLARVKGRAANEDDREARAPTDSVYRAVKWSMERALEASIERGLDAVTLMPGGCVGEYDARAGTGGILLAVASSALPWWVDGTVNLVDVRDVALAHVRALSAPRGARYCLGGHDVRMRSLLAMIAERYGGSSGAIELTAEQARARADEEERVAAANNKRVAFARELVDLVTLGQPVDDARAVRELGMTFGPLEAALDRAHRWYSRCGYLKTIPTNQPDSLQREGASR
ncbi:MAG: NAD-dependent epimerase/dehydratase family protein [Polyangiales bacterium]